MKPEAAVERSGMNQEKFEELFSKYSKSSITRRSVRPAVKQDVMEDFRVREN